MAIVLLIAICALAAGLLYLPFHLWFRRHRPTGDSPLAAKVDYTPAGWAFVAGQLVFMFAGLFIGNQDPSSRLGEFVHGDTGIVKWFICTLVVTHVADTLLRGAGIALRRPAAEAAQACAAAPSPSRRQPGFHLATICGVPVVVHPSYLYGGLFIALMARTGVEGIVGYCLAYAALVAIHEAGHAITARSLGLKVHSVDLSGIGGLCRVEVPQRLRDVCLVWSAGLAAQAVILLSTLSIVAARGQPQTPFGVAVVTTFTWVNALLFLINLVPGRTHRGNRTDGGVLWHVARLRFTGDRRLRTWHLLPTRLFDPSTSLLGIEGMAPEGFRDGIEILNDDTTPMEFVTDILQRHVGMAPDVAAARMVDIHTHGGVLLPFPGRAAADAAAAAIARDTQARGYRLVCRAVTAAPAPSLPGG